MTDVTPTTPVIDCDVHCAVPKLAALAPYLPMHWQEHLGPSGYQGSAALTVGYREPPVLRTVSPTWSRYAIDGSGLTVQAVQRDLLTATTTHLILQCYYGVEAFTHPDLGPAMATAVNCWLQEEWLDRDDRFRASAVVSPQHVAASAHEIDRIARDPRFVQVLVPARSPAGYGERRYWPMWERAAEHGLAIAITGGGAMSGPPTPVSWPSSFSEDYATMVLSFQSHVISMVASGIFARFPSLRIVMLESGWTWLEPLLWRMDEYWKAFQREIPWVREPPSSYVRRHFRFTTQPVDAPGDAEEFRQLIRQSGAAELLMFGSDYPRRYIRDNQQILQLLTEDEKRNVLSTTAAKWYRLDMAP